MGRLGNTGARFAWWRSALGLASVVCATLACSSEQNDEVTLEVYNWWDSTDAERQAFAAVREEHARLNPHVRIDIVELDTSEEARVEIARRLLLRRPLSTFQANLGADVLDWAVVDSRDAAGVERSQRLIQGLSADLPDLEGQLPEWLGRNLRVNGDPNIFAVPINIHRLNLVYARRDERHDSWFMPGTTWCDETAEERLRGVTIAIGTGFARSLFALENVLLAVAGPEVYEKMFVSTEPDDGSWEEPARNALLCLQRLLPHFVPLSSWVQAADYVRDGLATLTVMGDWAGGHLRDELDAGTVTVNAFPGTEDLFVYTSDTFPLPVDAAHPREILALLDFIGSENAQLLFSDKKGSIPALKNADVTSLGQRAIGTKRDFESGDVRKVLATSGLLPSYFNLAALQAELALDPSPNATFNVERIMVRLRDAVAATRRWRERLRMGPAGLPP